MPPATTETTDTTETLHHCDCCHRDSDTTHTAVGDNSYCIECRDNNCTECHGCHEYIENDYILEGPDGLHRCETCHDDEQTAYCEDCEECMLQGDATSIDLGGDHRCVCQGCADHYVCCDDCGYDTRRDDTCTINDRVICDSCYEDHYSSCDGCGDCFHTESLNYCEDDGCHYCDDCGSKHAIQWQPEPAGVERSVGIELEFCEVHDHREDLAGWEGKSDGSVGPNGYEFASPILRDRSTESVTQFCKAARLLHFQVDKRCGFHLHVSARDLSPTQKRSVLVAYMLTEALFNSFVPESRRDGRFSTRITYSIPWCETEAEFMQWSRDLANRGDRYYWLNVAAYSEHGTFEIRLHSATSNSDKVNNWVALHRAFVEFVKDKSETELRDLFGYKSMREQFTTLESFLPSELTSYYRDRARKFGTNLDAQLIREAMEDSSARDSNSDDESWAAANGLEESEL